MVKLSFGRNARKMNNLLHKKNLTPKGNPGKFRHFKEIQKDLKRRNSKKHPSIYWVALEIKLEYAEKILYDGFSGNKTDFLLKIHNYASRLFPSVKVNYVLRGLSDRAWGKYQQLPELEIAPAILQQIEMSTGYYSPLT